MSGLHINATKSSLFIAGEDHLGVKTVAEEAGLALSHLPIRYLGLPLLTKAMSKIDYEPLVDRVRRRLVSWTHKALTFAGRLQLIKSVISGITNFWSSAFILPKKCLAEIESLCSAFLWSGDPNNCHKAKVAWEDVCVPKAEGGLGLRRLKDTSRVCALNLIWRLFTLAGSFWVAWIKHYMFKSTSFWDIKDTGKGSWMWSKLLKLRDQVYPFLRVMVGNGENTYFWTDNWMNVGKLIDITGDSGPCTFGISRHATVAEAASDTCWRIRSRIRQHLQLVEMIRNTSIPASHLGTNTLLWRRGEDDYADCFSAASTWDQIRLRKSKVAWSRVIWFSQGVPRFSFMAWLATRDRLTTGSRMRSMGILQGCVLCGEPDETRDHLFFACPYTFTVWLDTAGGLLGRSVTPDWNDTLCHLIQLGKHQNLDSILLRLAFQTVIYYCWKERNYRNHQRGSNTTSQLTKTIDRIIRYRILSLGYKFPHKWEGLLRRWLQLH